MEPAATARSGSRAPLSLATAVALLGIAAVVAAQYAWVKPTNFGGFDEWMILSLVERGIPDIPYANRPLGLVTSLPARFGPISLRTYHVLHTAYFAGLGCLVFQLCRRLHPRQPLVAFLAGVFAATWAPLDYQRLNVIQPYAGLTFSACLALVLLVESWLRGQIVLLSLGALVAFVSIRAYEGCGALLLCAPLLLLWLERPPPRASSWVAAWEAVVGLALALAALPFLLPARGLVYQAEALGGIDLHPLRVLGRLLEQYGYHLLPLVTIGKAEFGVPAVPVAAATFGLAFVAASRALRGEGGGDVAPRRRDLAGLMGLGLLLAGLGYGVLVLSSGVVRAARAQFFSAPGIGLFLASSFALLASSLPRLWRVPAIGLLGAWVVAAGMARTATLQGFWDNGAVHARQVRLLGRLVERAPHFKPNTFVILLDEGGAFDTNTGFRHALDYLYRGEAVGHAWGKFNLGYPARLTTEGIVSEPWRVLREAWQAPVTRHRYDEVVVLRQTAAGELTLLDEWPAGVLPPLAPGARYDPRSRILPGPPPPQRRILGPAFLP